MELREASSTNMASDALCRVCMCSAGDLQSIFGKSVSIERTLSQVVTYVTGIQIDENDYLPKQICQGCISLAESASFFKNLCHQSDVNFKKILSGDTVKAEPESRTQMEIECDSSNNLPLKDETSLIDNSNGIVKTLSQIADLYQCAICCLRFQLSSKLKEHIKKDHCNGKINPLDKSTKNKFSCEICSKVFQSLTCYKLHYRKCESKKIEDVSKTKKIKEEIVSSDSDTPLADNIRYDDHSESEYDDVSEVACDVTINGDQAEVKIEVPPITIESVSFAHDEDSAKKFKTYTCNKCNVSMSWMLLEDHVKTEHSLGISECRLLDYATADKKNIKATKSYTCLECNLSLPWKRFIIHMNVEHAIHLSNKISKSKKPCKKPRVIETRKSRRKIREPSESLDSCDFACNGEEVSGDDVKDLAKAVVPFSCTMCERKFSKHSALSLHLKKHDDQSGEVHTCLTCKREFKRKAHLDNHILTHSVEKGFKCSMCDKAFARHDSLSMHMANHEGIKKHQCNFCDKGFNMLSTLKDHIRTHTGEKPFLCSICGRGFSQSTNLKEHVRRHQGYKPFKCTFCEHKFVSKGELEAHTRKHSGAHPFVCDACGGGFTTSSSLVKHKRIHTGERPYQCDFCPMRFTALGTLKNHRRTHTGEKPYKCTYCDKAFAQKNDLVSHTRTHTGERPYVCSVCGHAFRQSSALKTHFKIHGGLGEQEVGRLDMAGIKVPDPMLVITGLIPAGSKASEDNSVVDVLTPKSETSQQ